LIATVLSVIGGGYGGLKHVTERKTAKKYKSHKQGVEAFNRKHDQELSAEIYNNIAEARKINGV
jgi:hypothetical protein